MSLYFAANGLGRLLQIMQIIWADLFFASSNLICTYCVLFSTQLTYMPIILMVINIIALLEAASESTLTMLV